MTIIQRVTPDPRPGWTRDDFLKFAADDNGNAMCMAALYSSQFRYCEAYGWVFYNGKYWDRVNAEALVKQAAVDTLTRRRMVAVKKQPNFEAIVRTSKATASNVRNCLYLFEPLVTVDVSEFDKSPDLLNCQNSVVDLRTGKIAPHDPRQYFTYAVPIDYDPTADTGQWLQFLLDVVGGKQEIVDYLQLSVGYSLTGHTWEEILFYVHGRTRSGKGTFTETLLAVMGKEPLATEVDFVTFTSQRDHDTQNFDLAPLKPCRFIVASESSKYQTFNTAKVKQLTGGNDIRCAFKHKTHFSYRPQFKLWLFSNESVNADPDDDAVWYRIRVIEFPNSYVGREDKRLKARLREPDNLRGVLAWAIEGAQKWYALEERGLQTPAQIQDATEKARDEVDFVQQWLDEYVEKTGDDNDQLSSEQMHISYKTWCENNGVKPKGKRTLTSSLKKKGFNAGEKIELADGREVRGCIGVRFIKAKIEEDDKEVDELMQQKLDDNNGRFNGTVEEIPY